MAILKKKPYICIRFYKKNNKKHPFFHTCSSHTLFIVYFYILFSKYTIEKNKNKKLNTNKIKNKLYNSIN